MALVDVLTPSSPPGMARKARKLLSAWWLPLARRAAQSYVVGPEVDDALRACLWLAQQGMASTVAFWNMDSHSPREVTDAYLASLNGLAKQNLDCYLSVKAPAMDYSRELLAEVLESSQHTGTRVHFDSHGPETADQIFALIAQAPPHAPGLSCTLPGRWPRSQDDADWAVDLQLAVRVVKGQWPDPAAPPTDQRAGFLAVVDRLAGRARLVAVATHDPPLAREALARLQAAGTSCELELLFGLPIWPALHVARAAGVPVRVYIPFGYAWLPYCLSQARKNPRILLWVLRDQLLGRSLRLPGRASLPLVR